MNAFNLRDLQAPIMASGKTRKQDNHLLFLSISTPIPGAACLGMAIALLSCQSRSAEEAIMKNATYPNNDLPNRCGGSYPIQDALNSYLSDIIVEFIKRLPGTVLEYVGLKTKGKKDVESRFKMEEPKFVQRVNIRQAVKYGALLYIIAAMLTIPAGICSHQHITPPLPSKTASITLPSFTSVIDEMAQAYADDARVKMEAQVKAESAANAPPFERHVLHASQTYAVDVALIRAIIMAESSNNPKAVSHRGARGLMQLMPRTAKSLGVEDSFNPAHNIDGGVRYFRQLLDRFEGDEKLALAAYNAGSRHVRNYGGVPPFKATRIYIKKVLKYRQDFEKEMNNQQNGAITS